MIDLDYPGLDTDGDQGCKQNHRVQQFLHNTPSDELISRLARGER
jgi:hypothetical protein